MKNLFLLALLAAAIVGALRFREWYSGDAASTSPPTVEVPPQLLGELSNSLIFVEGNAGKGSGFICKIAGAKFIITNQHVVAGNSGAKFTLLDQSPIRTGQAASAVGHDIMSFALLSDANAMEIMLNVEKNATVGDDVAVLGNGEGARVIKPLGGKLVGIGPDRVEVSAAWLPGNSGSPIIHLKSGKVIGIATFHTVQDVDLATGKPKEHPEARYFGYRLDTVKQWQPIAWPAYVADYTLLEKIKARTNDFLKLDLSLNFTPSNYGDPAIRNSLERYASAKSVHGLIKSSPLSAVTDVITGLRHACETDILAAQAQVNYDYFRRQLEDQRKFRLELYKALSKTLQKLHK